MPEKITAPNGLARSPTRVVAAMAVQRAIALYLKTGLKVNSAYTPANMRATASRYTGTVYPASRQGLERAAVELANWIEQAKWFITEKGEGNA